jgi:hypothetical protein
MAGGSMVSVRRSADQAVEPTKAKVAQMIARCRETT